MKIWQLTFLDSAYLKYESKLKLPLLPKMHSYLFSRPLSQDFVLTIMATCTIKVDKSKFNT